MGNAFTTTHRRVSAVAAALMLPACGSIERVAFTIGYKDATVGIEADLRDSGKNPISRRGGKNPIARRAPDGK